MELLIEYMARGFVIMLLISMPCVLVAAGIGLVVGILQAVTQVQEQTIAAAPKILGVFLVIIIGGIGFVRLLTNFFTEGVSVAFNVVPKADSYVLPSDYYKYTRPFAGEMNDTIKDNPDIQDLINKSGKSQFENRQEKFKYSPAPKSAQPRPNFVETKKILGR